MAEPNAPHVPKAPTTIRMGAVHLTVADLARSLAFYEHVLGLRVHAHEGGRAELGTGGEALLVLTEERGAQPADGYSGLFHFALLVPERKDLARWLAHVARERVPLQGVADHAVSEAVYLGDPDHHGIEVYWDRPRELWDGRVAELLTTMPLDTADLLGELDDPAGEPFDGLAAGTQMGHVHLRVADAGQAVGFYRDVLGLDLMATMAPSAAFLAAGGYHHHIGANTWESAGAPPAPPGTARLAFAEVVLPDAAARDRIAQQVTTRTGQAPEPTARGVLVRDPSGNALELRT